MLIWPVYDITGYSLPISFLLGTNDTSAKDSLIESPGFYIQPSNYPTSFEFSMNIEGGFTFPTAKHTEALRFNDTVVFTWDPPVSEGLELQMALISEKYKFHYFSSGMYITKPQPSRSSSSNYPVTAR
jgi:hypothetical protein